MKFRPQFSLRLMLLIVALIASLVGWRTAVEQEKRENRSGERRMLQQTLAQLEADKSRLEQRLIVGESNRLKLMTPLQSQISDLKQQIDELSK
jgi:uncharacterized protein HemX